MFPNGQGNMLKEGSILCSPRVLVFKTDDRIWCHSVLHPSLHQSRWLIQQKSKLKRRHSCRLRSLLFPLSFLISMAWLPSKCQKVKYRHLFLWVFPLKPQFSTLCWLSYIQMEGNMMPLINIWKQFEMWSHESKRTERIFLKNKKMLVRDTVFEFSWWYLVTRTGRAKF